MCSQSLQENRPVALSVVLSFWNEAEVLEELTSRLHRILDEECQKGTIHSYELIFVNDASTDNSEPILRELAQVHRDIKIVTMSRKFGVSPCVLAGMECASGEALIYMDADLQDPPEVIPKILQVWRNLDDIDIVHTVRTKRLGESAIKLWITRIGYRTHLRS
ncbi:glycosyltransferase family 2 protein [Tumidithrix elongata RA019]|uniref:Glycosyltransferase family 2 protein n=1 Tax=Tumidithrix elongata BACA0141 TaxID=2716417 RepID=A0AAW9PYJ5_9CYAN|nr:glycosyltransferase family 2 protein [Tumidithrix elongata RA019]